MGRYPSYPDYRQSGSRVLGEIPAQWLMGRLKFNVDPRRPITYGIVQCGPDVEMGIPYIRPVDMNDESGITLALKDFQGLLIISAGQFTRSCIGVNSGYLG